MHSHRTGHLTVALALSSVWWLAAGCREQPPAPASPQRPPARADRRPPEPDTLTPEAPDRPAPPPAEPPQPQDPFRLSIQLPTPQAPQHGWVHVLKFFNQGPPARVEALWEGGNRITVDTQNVRHLSLDLGQLPVDPRKSVVLRLNGQGIQLSSKHGPVVHFERGQAGNWSLLRD